MKSWMCWLETGTQLASVHQDHSHFCVCVCQGGACKLVCTQFYGFDHHSSVSLAFFSFTHFYSPAQHKSYFDILLSKF